MSTKDFSDSMSIRINDKKFSNLIITASLLTLAIYIVPFLSIFAMPFLWLSTLFHEMFHGIAALLFGGNFNSMRMFADGSGVADISGNFGRIARAMIAMAGLIGPAITAAIFFRISRSTNKSRALLCILGVLLSLSLLLLIRNLFAIFFVAALIAACFFFSLGTGKNLAQSVLAFLAVQLSLSVFSRSDYLFTQTAMTSRGPMPSDVAQMAEALWLPYWFFGIICGLISIIALYLGIRSHKK